MARDRYLLDTNVVSELGRSRPHTGVLRLLSNVDDSGTFLSVITYGELRRGVLMAERKHLPSAAGLRVWLASINARFREQLLPVDPVVMEMWAEFSSERTRPVLDTLIAATAHVHDCTLVTRNGTDFSELPVKLLNPWEV